MNDTPTPRRDDEARDPALDALLGVWRDDCRAVATAPHLAARVLAAAARGDVESSRFQRFARAYAVAATLVAAASIVGALWLRHTARPATVASVPRVTDLEEARLSLAGLESVADLSVGGR